MIDLGYMVTSILIMAGVTYLTRVLSMVLFTRKFRSRFLASFLHYVPYGVLAALIVPATFTSASNVLSSVIGTAAALLLSLCGQKLLVVSAGAVAAVYLTELLQRLLG